MAKKNLTPEELQVKMEKRSEKSKVFFGTFTKALAVFLAIVMAWSLVVISMTAPKVGSGNSVAVSGDAPSESTPSGDTPSGDSSVLPEDPALPEDPSGDATGDATGDAPEGEKPAEATKADVAKLLNEVTAKAAKQSYKWTRKSWYTKPLDVGNATGTLNKVIGMVDKNANLDSVVGGFLSITGSESDPAWEGQAKNGALPGEGKMKEEKFLLKAFSLTEADIMDMRVSGNTYTLQLKGCKSPLKDGKNALNRATNDFITKDEISKGVSDALGSLGNLVTINSLDVDFTAIVIVANVENNALKDIKLSYTMTVNALKLKAMGIGITGTGAGKMECTYSNFA